MMVTPVNGFQSSDGMVFADERLAYIQELRIALLTIFGGNEGIVNQIISNRASILPPMQSLVNFEASLPAATNG